MMTKAKASPGPGVWTLDGSHFERPMSRFLREHFMPAFEEGQSRWAQRYGAPMRTVAMRDIDGFLYIQPMPLGGPPGSKPPPKPLFRLLFALVPELRRRTRAAAAAMEGRIWREDVRVWRENTLPALFARLRALEDEAIETVSDDTLCQHLHGCAKVFSDAIAAHIETNGMCMIPSGHFVAEVQRWTGASTVECLEAIQGGMEPAVSLGSAVREALDAAGESALLHGDPEAVIEELRARNDAVGELARQWLDHAEPRLLFSGDLHQPLGRERPDLLVEQLREGRGTKAADASAAERLRARVPAEERATFDSLLDEARSTYGVRDERCAHLDTWMFGLCRRATLEAGRRLAERGLLEDREDAIHLRVSELESMLLRAEGPSPDEIAAHKESHRRTIDDVPRFVGGEVMPMPSHDLFPGAMSTLMRALAVYVTHMDEAVEEKPKKTESEKPKLSGLPASRGVHEGIARVVKDPSDFSRIRPGDVLVARCTMPSYNGVMALSGAVVTDRGGALSHAAIVSRELGIPAVVGTREATRVLSDGVRVRVDGEAGTVEVL